MGLGVVGCVESICRIGGQGGPACKGQVTAWTPVLCPWHAGVNPDIDGHDHDDGEKRHADVECAEPYTGQEFAHGCLTCIREPHHPCG